MTYTPFDSFTIGLCIVLLVINVVALWIASHKDEISLLLYYGPRNIKRLIFKHKRHSIHR